MGLVGLCRQEKSMQPLLLDPMLAGFSHSTPLPPLHIYWHVLP